jgi:hypothetical protein
MRVGPGRDHVLIRRDSYAHILPAADCGTFAAGQDWDRLVTEREIAHAARGDGGPQPLVRERRRG